MSLFVFSFSFSFFFVLFSIANFLTAMIEKEENRRNILSFKLCFIWLSKNIAKEYDSM